MTLRDRWNLAREPAILGDERPAPWRGWQRAILIAAAVFSPLLGALAAFAATDSNWRARRGEDSGLLPALLCVLELCMVPLLYYFARRESRTAKFVGGAVVLAALAGLVIAWVQVPAKTASSGVGDRVPLLVTSLLLLLLAGAASLASSWPAGRLRPTPNRRQLLAGLTTVAVIFVVTVFVGLSIGRGYLLDSNEYLTGTNVPAGEVARPELDGRPAWVSNSSSRTGDALRGAVATRHGIAIARESGTIEMLDPATGEQRWRYHRSDSDERPALQATAGGQLLIADFGEVGYLVLDAATGQRKQAWPLGTRDHQIESPDPLLTGQEVSKGSDKLRGVDLDGKARWTFEPGRCTTISAAATTDTAIANLSVDCGDRVDRTTALDLKTGKKLWSRPIDWIDRPVAVSGLIVGIEPDGRATGEMHGTVVGVDPRTGAVKWRWQLPSAWACGTKFTTAGDQVVLVSCPTTATKETQTVVTVLDGESGGVVWQRTGPVKLTSRLAVTTDARVVTIPDPNATDRCLLDLIDETGYRQVTLPDDVRCNVGIQVVGNQVLMSGRNSVIALR